MIALARVIPARQRQALTVAFAVTAAIIAFATVHTLSGVGGSGLDVPIRDWATAAVYVLVALIVIARAVRVSESRAAWAVIAAGVTLYGAGNLVWSFWLEHVANPPIPSICDVLWLSLYPASYLGVAMLARRHWRGIPAGVWLDGIVAGLAIAAIGAALVFGPVLANAAGSRTAIATNLAYPIADLLLAALVVGVLSLRGWRVDRSWALLGGGFLVLTVADSIYLTQIVGGSAASSNVANLFYMAGVGMLALAAWQPPERAELPRTEGLSTLLIPGGFALSAVGVLAYDHYKHLGSLAFFLSLLTVLIALLRTALAFRDLRTFNETRRQAVTDDLTGLPNRRLFQQRLGEALDRTRSSRRSVALMIVDLDRFKELNDTLGHHSGDVLLRQIGSRLATVLRPIDTLARLGGDEFGIVLAAPSDGPFALSVADRVRDALAQPFDVQELALRVDASVGIALFPDDADSAEELLQRADVAMYQAKKAQSGRELYARERDTYSRDRLALAAELERALRNGEIGLYFQPQADLRTGQIVGLEALARWQHPAHGLLLPDVFIPLAETTGLIRTLTRRVLDLALSQCVVWRAAGLDLHVSVNFSVTDLLDVDLPGEVAAELERHQLPPSALHIEVTENAVFTDPIRIGDVLQRLARVGVGLALDDFGTGFSSLGHLKSLPVGEIKIDRSFVTAMISDRANSAIVRATIQLAHELGKTVVAEGVEDQATWELLEAAGCQFVQGYRLSRPLPAEQLTALVHERGQRQREVVILGGANAA